MPYIFEPIGIIRSPYKEKFGIPRQSLLAKPVTTTLELLPPYNHPDSVRGIAAFSHVWINFIFHETAHRGWSPLVRPPRLGGNTRVGVFASRSPYRPNPLGLSLVELIAVNTTSGVTLTLAGADLLDCTVVVDIKPYLPFIEAIPNAQSGFVTTAPPRLTVIFLPRAQEQLAALSGQIVEETRLIQEVLAHDPRPAYHDDPTRCYGIILSRYNIRFRVRNNQVEILEIFAYP